jgi:ribonuclease VapC
MFVDASALVAMLAPEDDGALFASRLDSSRSATTSPLAVFETVLALRRLREVASAEVLQVVLAFLDRSKVEVVGMEPGLYLPALRAHDLYGKGSGHPARLNIGDCFSYAMAKHAGVPLLYKGEDFAQTDLA